MVREMRRALLVCTLGSLLPTGCAFKGANDKFDAGGGSGSGSGAGSGSGLVDAGPGVGDAFVYLDAPAALPLYAMSGADLYALDVDAKSSTKVGPVTDGGTTVASLAGLAWNGTTLIGLDSQGGTLYSIDRTSGAITAQKTLSTDGLGGLTVIPPHPGINNDPVILAAAQDTLYRIAPATGTVTPLGTFSNGATFRSDLAWVEGAGLFVTLTVQNNGGGGTTGSTVELARIDPRNGSTQADLKTGYDNINGLSGYRNKLWGVSQGGNCYTIDTTTGTLAVSFGGGPTYTEAAQ